MALNQPPLGTPDSRRHTVCIAANTSWYIYNFRARLIGSLLKEGYIVQAYSPIDDYVGRIRSLGAGHTPLVIHNASTNPVYELATILAVAKTLRAIKPSAVLTYTPKVNIYVSLAARVLRIPVIANISGLGRSFASDGWIQFVTRKLYRVALRHPSVVFFQNNEDRADFVKHGLVAKETGVRLPGSGVDVDRFIPFSGTRDTSKFTFLLSARLLWEKGILEYVEAAKLLKRRYPNARFWLLGFLDSGHPNAVPIDYIRRAVDEGVIEYLGATDDVVTVYKDVDCFVLPTYYREGVPRSILETASMGIPVVTTDAPGCRDAVEDGVTGFICRKKDPLELTTAMERVLRMPLEHRSKMGFAAREKMLQEFDERQIITRYIAALRLVTQRSLVETR